jgi:hypothetical protein
LAHDVRLSRVTGLVRFSGAAAVIAERDLWVTGGQYPRDSLKGGQNSGRWSVEAAVTNEAGTAPDCTTRLPAKPTVKFVFGRHPGRP